MVIPKITKELTYNILCRFMMFLIILKGKISDKIRAVQAQTHATELFLAKSAPCAYYTKFLLSFHNNWLFMMFRHPYD